MVHSESETDSQKSSKQGLSFSNKKDAIDAFKALLKDKVCLYFYHINFKKNQAINTYTGSLFNMFVGASNEADHQRSEVHCTEAPQREETGLQRLQDPESQRGKGWLFFGQLSDTVAHISYYNNNTRYNYFLIMIYLLKFVRCPVSSYFYNCAFFV